MKKNFARVNTPLPGPKASLLLERRKNIVPKGISNGIPTFISSAKGAILTDVDGNTFIDFAGAIGCINVGHCHPKVTNALHEQIQQYVHPGFNVMMYEPYILLAEKLAEIAPGPYEKQVMFANSGAEAVENAVKIARKYTGRQGIVVFQRGFHGRTLLAMTMTSKVHPYKFGFGPFAPEIYKAPYPYPYRRPQGMSVEEYSQHVIQEFKTFLLGDVAPETIAAVVMEPVQGEGGFIIPPSSFVQGISEICKKHNILFIADEIQTGFSRTGKYFAMEHFGIIPDLITVSKSLGAGMPISGVIGRKEIMERSNPGELGGTFAGNPLGCRAALAVLDIIEKENLNQRGMEIGKILMERLQRLMNQYDIIGEVRGLGAMCAIEFVTSKKEKEPNPAIVKSIIGEAYGRGLVTLNAGLHGNILRFLMPLAITDQQLTEGLDILEEAIEAVAT
ncbi:MAG TPA: 4-aminobutyrate--2-oxoglutarate transaminase [Paenibacillaceae bacterium]|nr:4-aminobutyrate--2-oxoglutarate transaminase [Paenibacillaceae bacterium]